MSAAETILRWLEGRDAAGISRRDFAEGDASLASELRRAGFGRFASAIGARAASEGTIEAEPDVETALAFALADYAAHVPDAARFEVVDQLLGRDRVSWHSFQSRVVNRLNADPAALQSLKDRLAAEPALLVTAPSTVAMHSGVAPAAFAQRHCQGASVRDMWGAGFSAVHLRSTMEHAVVRQSDPAGWIGILERHTFPEPVHGIVECSAFESVDDLVPLLSAAAPAFDEQGRWSSDRFVVFPLIAAACVILQRLAGSGSDSPEPDEAAFGNALDALVSTLATRADFLWLGHAWLQRLAWEANSFKVWPPGTPTMVAACLARRLNAIEDPMAWIGKEDELFRLDRLIAALLPLAHSARPAEAGALLTSVIERNLVDTISLPEAISSSGTLVTTTLSLALSVETDLAGWFSGVWRNCFAVRDRHRHHAGRAALGGRDAGAMAIACGTAVIATRYRDPEAADAIGDLWELVRAAVVETDLTTRSGQGSVAPVAARWLALSFSTVHRAADGVKRKARLSSFLGPLNTDLHAQAGLVDLLVAGDATVVEIDAALGGHTVAARFERLLTDARLAAPSGFADRRRLEALADAWRRISAGPA